MFFKKKEEKEEESVITGVDKLVNIIKDKKKISIDKAAKLTGVNPARISEWADFLEEEGIIDIKPGLVNTLLVIKNKKTLTVKPSTK